MIQTNTQLSFKAISERLCLAEISNGKEKYIVFSAYAPTSDQTKKHQKIPKDFTINGLLKYKNVNQN